MKEANEHARDPLKVAEAIATVEAEAKKARRRALWLSLKQTNKWLIEYYTDKFIKYRTLRHQVLSKLVRVYRLKPLGYIEFPNGGRRSLFRIGNWEFYIPYPRSNFFLKTPNAQDVWDLMRDRKSMAVEEAVKIAEEFLRTKEKDMKPLRDLPECE